jgi:hypothetical protein
MFELERKVQAKILDEGPIDKTTIEKMVEEKFDVKKR